MQDRSWAEQCQVIGNAGYTGVEIASFTLVDEGVQELSQSDRQQLVADMDEAGIECAGLHWLLAPPPEGLHFTHPQESRRREAIAYLDELIDFCGDLEGDVLVFGSPNQRGTVDGLSVEQAVANFADGLSQVADHAEERGVKILVEPLGSEQTDVVNTMAEAVALVEEIDHPAISGMFDFHNTTDETDPFEVLVEQHFDYINHVHVQEMDGTYLGTGNAVTEFVPAFQKLKDLGFDQWVSLEVFDFEHGGETIAN
jgi:sugar phosphate isomerase/epimerase